MKIAVENRRCPYCKRELAVLYSDGTFDLAGKAELHGAMAANLAQARPDAGGRIAVPLTFSSATQAKCRKPLCRLRGWLDGR